MMKRKNLNKKLDMKKQTIASLSNDSQGKLLGGDVPQYTACDVNTNCRISRCMTICGGANC